MYYEDEYEDYDDYDDYEDYCPCCTMYYENCYCGMECYEEEKELAEVLAAGHRETVTCTCGGLLDAHDLCPYCDYLPFE